MNCLEFRRTLYGNPDERSEAFARHRANCPECRAAAERIRRIDLTLSQALDVPVPDGLASRVLLKHRHMKGTVWRRGVPIPWAAAAVLSIGVAGWFGYEYGQIRNPALPEAVLAVVQRDLTPLTRLHSMQAPAVRAALAQVGASLTGDLPPVFHARKCNIRGNDGVHLVLDGASGRVTVFLLPAEMTRGRMLVEDEAFHGLIAPGQRGSIVVLGEPGEQLEQTLRRIDSSVSWL